jgi:hypothetical protein
MTKSSFRDQPLVVKAAVFITFFNAWVLFEELVVDRHGLWRYLPFYRVGLFCVWDLLALAVIGLSLFLRLGSSQRSQGQTSAPWCHVRWCPVC